MYKEVTYVTDDGEEVTEALPAHWEICGVCEGEGSSCAHLGVFTTDDFREDPEFAEAYFGGSYDRPCGECDGSGKVQVIEVQKCMPLRYRRALRYSRRAARLAEEAYRERKHESLMLGETQLSDWY